MRISDWSSDVCSSDLSHSRFQEVPFDEAGEWRVMHVWAVANQKGGVGKTTTAAALGGLLADRSARTLLVDMDPHGSLTTYLGFDADAAGAGVYALFRACVDEGQAAARSEEHTSELQSLMRISDAVICLKKKRRTQ